MNTYIIYINEIVEPFEIDADYFVETDNGIEFKKDDKRVGFIPYDALVFIKMKVFIKMGYE